jgi:hypothetical protein
MQLSGSVCVLPDAEFAVLAQSCFNFCLTCRLSLPCYGGAQRLDVPEPDGVRSANQLWQPPTIAQHQHAHAEAQRSHDNAGRSWGRGLHQENTFPPSLQGLAHERLRALDTRPDHGQLHIGWSEDVEDVALKGLFEQLLDVISAQGQKCPANPSGLHAAKPWRAVESLLQSKAAHRLPQHTLLLEAHSKPVSANRRQLRDWPLFSNEPEAPVDAKAAFGWPPLGDARTACRMKSLETIMAVCDAQAAKRGVHLALRTL